MTQENGAPQGRSTRRLWLLISGVVLVAALAAGAAYLAMGGLADEGGGERAAGQRAAGEETTTEPEAGLGSPTLGDEDAPVTMVEYSDFQCPYCGEFAREVEPELVEEYVESGTLKIEWRDFPYLGQESVNAALAARAAQEQGKFWEYHEVLYDNQESQNNGAFSDENLVRFAGEADLNVERFEEDFTSGRYERVMNEDFQSGIDRGIQGTPTFIINGETLVGAQPLQNFEQTIEAAEREAGESGE